MKPVSGRAIALLTANEVMTHVAWLALAPRLPEMVGNETLAMVVSSTCMNDASARPIVASARFGGANGLAAGSGVTGRPKRSSSVCDGGHGRDQRLAAPGRFCSMMPVISASASSSCFV